jgi:hypothetical protein
MTGVGTNIAANDYNNIYNTIAPILGTASTGYGQAVQSSQVSTAATITVGQWNALESDITAMFWHQLHSAPSPALTHATNLIKIREDDRAKYLKMAQALANPNPTSVDSVSYPGCYALAPTGEVTTPSGGTFPVVSIRGTRWGGSTSGPVVESNIPTVTHTTQLVWPSAAAAQYFFNSGGSITFSASRSGGTTTTKNTSWTDLLSTMSTITFSYSGCSSPGTGQGSSYGWSWFNANLNTSSIEVFTRNLGAAGTALYAPNKYNILVSIDAAGRSLTFACQFQDLSNATTENQYKNTPGNIFDIDEDIDGTLTSTLNIKYASGAYVTAVNYLPSPVLVTSIGP